MSTFFSSRLTATSRNKMASNFYTFSFERFPGRTGDLAAQIPRPPSTPSAVNSSFPALSRRAASGTATAALAAGNASASRPPRKPVDVAGAQEVRYHARLLYMKRAITSRFRAWHRGLDTTPIGARRKNGILCSSSTCRPGWGRSPSLIHQIESGSLHCSKWHFVGRVLG